MPDTYDQVVASLYCAAVDRRRWREAFAAIQQLVPADGIGLCVWREGTLVDLIVTDSYDPGLVQDYVSRYATIDPRQDVIGRAAPGSVIELDRHPETERLRSSAFYREFLVRTELQHAVGIHCAQHNGNSTRLKLERGPRHGPFTADEIARLRALAPHLRSVAELRDALPEGVADPSVGQAALDHMADGALVIDANGSPRWLNPAAVEMLAADDGLALRDGRLRAGRSFETARLLKHLAKATRPRVSIGGAMPVGRPSARPPYALVIAPLGPMTPVAAMSEVPLALLLIRDPDRYADRLAHQLGEFFGLSEAEHRLAVALLQGRSLQQSAAMFGKRLPTVRTQLRSILAKSGARNQADLLRILLSLPALR